MKANLKETNTKLKPAKKSLENKQFGKIVTIAFIILVLLSLVFHIIYFLNANDQCHLVDKPCEYFLGTDGFINDSAFINLKLFESILAIIVSILFGLMAAVKKQWIKVVLGVIGLLIVPIIWW